MGRPGRGSVLDTETHIIYAGRYKLHEKPQAIVDGKECLFPTNLGHLEDQKKVVF